MQLEICIIFSFVNISIRTNDEERKTKSVMCSAYIYTYKLHGIGASFTYKINK